MYNVNICCCYCPLTHFKALTSTFSHSIKCKCFLHCWSCLSFRLKKQFWTVIVYKLSCFLVNCMRDIGRCSNLVVCYSCWHRLTHRCDIMLSICSYNQCMISQLCDGFPKSNSVAFIQHSAFCTNVQQSQRQNLSQWSQNISVLIVLTAASVSRKAILMKIILFPACLSWEKGLIRFHRCSVIA